MSDATNLEYTLSQYHSKCHYPDRFYWHYRSAHNYHHMLMCKCLQPHYWCSQSLHYWEDQVVDMTLDRVDITPINATQITETKCHTKVIHTYDGWHESKLVRLKVSSFSLTTAAEIIHTGSLVIRTIGTWWSSSHVRRLIVLPSFHFQTNTVTIVITNISLMLVHSCTWGQRHYQ